MEKIAKVSIITTVFLLTIGCEKSEPTAEKQKDIMHEVLDNEDINVSSIIENPIIYESVNFMVTINNNDLGVSKIEVFIGDEIVDTEEGSKEFEINLDPEDFPAGDTVLTLKITDSNNNITQHEYPVSIHRTLLELDLPEGFFLPSRSEFFFFASSIDGKLLATKKVNPESQNFKLTTSMEISSDTPYMLTYAAKIVSDSFNQTDLFTIKDLTRNNLRILIPKIPTRYGNTVRNEYNANGFSESDLFNFGTILPSYGYGVEYYSNSNAFVIDEIEMSNSNRDITDYYVPIHNLSQNDFAYIWLKKEDLSSDFTLDANDLIREGIELRTLDGSYNDGAGDDRYGYLTILGYKNEQDFTDGIFHYIWQHNHTISKDFPDSNSIRYFFNNTFEKYSHVFHWEDYYTKRVGAPLNDVYDIPTWSFDYVHSGKEIDLVKNGNGHITGTVFLNNLNDVDIVDGDRTLYNWRIIFDSQSTSKIVLPELPEEIKAWEFGKLHDSNKLLVERVLLHSYEGIPNYSDYLDKVIKTNENILHITPNLQAKFINRRGNQWVIEDDSFFR
ncbi:hypothetical protein [Ulvibacterium sp.]|uniref:hypothetical protein n=1 Tax=Ulvibacterium sp. TaxID=2665914 RepID=UPI003BA86BA1